MLSRPLAAFAALVACGSGHSRAAATELEAPLPEGVCSAGALAGARCPHSGPKASQQAAREHVLLQVGTAKARISKPGAHGEASESSTSTSNAELDFWERIRRKDGNALASSSPGLGIENWCHTGAPESGWSLKNSCAETGLESLTTTMVLTYNLYWWNLFERRGGGDAGALIAANGPYDVMAFQECDNVSTVLRQAEHQGLPARYAGIQGGHALGMAYDKQRWELLETGVDDVAEDRPEQYYGLRGVQWVRLSERTTGKKVTFLNHHGPLRVGTGGACGRHATAWNLLHAIRQRAQIGDGLVLMGDFNAPLNNLEVQELQARLHLLYSGQVMGGIDHIFSNCGGSRVVSAENLGDGGSDHEALRVAIRF
mmetsp:Transcript_68787/g.222251  ORF Transcript_68787/g.222251 Transcript_68787/m.222251 type:complete len:370 (+) Transcript_68787:77-1186(+)